MKQKIISALFLSGTMLVSNFAFAEHYRNLPYIGILKPEVYGG